MSRGDIFGDLKFTELTPEMYKWMDDNFDYYQATYFRKFSEMAKGLQRRFGIRQPVCSDFIRNRIIAHWVCFHFLSYPIIILSYFLL